MIGSASSVENTVNALEAGITTLGNISQYFSWDYKESPDIQERTVQTVTAIAIMAECKEKGAIIHSNLDDGFGRALGSLDKMNGWAKLEKFIAEDLLHARLTHSFGDYVENY